MKFSEFVNRNKNVVQSFTAKRITDSIQVTEERDAFFNGELFKKYDMVESDGKQFRILEQCSNYYQVVDNAGNVFRKFAKQLTKAEPQRVNMLEDAFHGYVVTSDESKRMLSEADMSRIDDVGFLKQLKEADKMSTSLQSKDKLTVAKIIADAIGVPHDAISDPTNLVNAAIRKAKKDPTLMKNRAILQNMLQIARDVGIKYSDTAFDVNEAVEKIDSHFFFGRNSRENFMNTAKVIHGDGITSKPSKIHGRTDFHNKAGEHIGFHEIDGEGDHTHKLFKKPIKESVELDENEGDHIFKNPNAKMIGGRFKDASAAEHKKAIKYHEGEHKRISALSTDLPNVQVSKHYKATHTAFHKMRADVHREHLNSMHESVELDEISKKLAGNYYSAVVKKHVDKVGVKPNMYDRVEKDLGKKRKQGMDRAFDRITKEDVDTLEENRREHVEKMQWHEREAARHSARTDITSGQRAKLIAKHKMRAQMHSKAIAGLHEEVELEELSTTKLKSYSEYAKSHATKLVAQASKVKNPAVAHAKLDKAGKRLDGVVKADKKAFGNEWKKRIGQTEAVTFANLKSQLDERKKIETVDDLKDVPMETGAVPQQMGSMMNPTSNTNRMALVRKLQGHD